MFDSTPSQDVLEFFARVGTTQRMEGKAQMMDAHIVLAPHFSGLPSVKEKVVD